MVLMIPWYIYAFASVILGTIFSIYRKKALLTEHAMNFESARTLTIALLCLFLIPYINLNVNRNIIILVYLVSFLVTAGILFTAKALRHKAISLIFPLGNIKPAFVAVIAFFFLSEAIQPKQIIGIIILFISAYLLESDYHISDFIVPLKHVFKTKYSLYFIFAVFLFSITAVFDRFVISNYMNIFTYFFLLWIFVAVNFNIVHVFEYGYRDTINCFKRITYLPLLVAFLSTIKNLFVYKALSLAYVSLVVPVLMLETLFVVLFGGRFFHEKYLFFRFGVSALMLIGAYLIIL